MKITNNQPNYERQDRCSEQVSGSLFEICVKGQLDSSWSDWLEGMEVKLLDNEKMLLCGYVVDQAALIGLLNKLCSLNLPVFSLRQVEGEEKPQETNKKEK
jgi:hypothetical protein